MFMKIKGFSRKFIKTFGKRFLRIFSHFILNSLGRIKWLEVLF